MGFLGLSETDKDKLQYEVISDSARLKLTRLIRMACNCEDNAIQILRQNRYINIANNVLGRPLYILEPDDWGEYLPPEHAWHYGEIEIIMKRPTTIQLVEIIGDLIQENLISDHSINEVLEEDGSSVHFETDQHRNTVQIHIVPIESIEEISDSDEHPNIRKLVKRMENALAGKDFPAVLHSSASIFETLAIDVIGLASIENQSLGSFFDRYRKDSKLPEPVLDFILDIYKKRNSEPLAGHGSIQTPTINEEEAIVLTEMTKTFVRIERKLAFPLVTKR